MNTLKNSKTNLIDNWLNEFGDKETEKLVARNVAISNRIIKILKDKNMSRVEFADILGKKPSEISKLLSGRHNINIKTIVKMEVALKEDILSIIDDISKAKTKIVYLTVHKNPAITDKAFRPVQISLNDSEDENVCELCQDVI